MNKIVFFSIPAYGHTNPTIELVRELVSRGNEVWYYSFNEFKEKIENAGAKFISCDDYIPPLLPKDEKKVGKDFSALIEMVVDTTIALDNKVCKELQEINPDCIVSDSMSIWGKLFALKLDIPYICSTTTFAFNDHTSKMIKQGFGEIFRMIFGIGKVNKKIKLLRANGFHVDNFISLVKNDNDTDTIVYTSKEFQPMSETFSQKYCFIGPSVSSVKIEPKDKSCKKLYISLGTVNNNNIEFYKNCIKAFEHSEIDVLMSVGTNVNINDLDPIPNNIQIKDRVNQIEVLQDTDVFLTHCGMNSANESLYYGVPMVLFPQHSEQKMVAQRVATLGAGLMLKRSNPNDIKDAVMQVINNDLYKIKADEISKSFKNAGGAKVAANSILNIANKCKINS